MNESSFSRSTVLNQNHFVKQFLTQSSLSLFSSPRLPEFPTPGTLFYFYFSCAAPSFSFFHPISPFTHLQVVPSRSRRDTLTTEIFPCSNACIPGTPTNPVIMSSNRTVPVVTNRPTRETQTQPRELLYVLQQKNPEPIDCYKGVSKNNTTSANFDNVQWNDRYPNVIQKWDDFTYEAIIAAYGDILASPSGQSSQLNSYLQQSDIPLTPREIYMENNVDTLGISWTCNVLRDPLKTAARTLNRRFKDAIGDVTLGSKMISWKNPDNARSSFNPDWAIIDRTKTKNYSQEGNADAKPTLYAVGDSKLSQKWKSTWLRHEDPKQAGLDSNDKTSEPKIRTERTKPLQQMATYCRIGETRYGYVVTQNELVVLRARRISKIDPGSTLQFAAFEYKAIPWSDNGPGKLTVNLAIWALGCMGMNTEHRAMEMPNHDPLDMMARLTWWEPVKTGSTLLRNVISHRELKLDDLKKVLGGQYVLTKEEGNSYTLGFRESPVPPRPSRNPGPPRTNQGPPPTSQGPPPTRQGPPPTSQGRNAPPQGPQQSGRPPATTTRPAPASTPAAPKRTYLQLKGRREQFEYQSDSKGRYIILSNKKGPYVEKSRTDNKYYVKIESTKPPVEVKFLS